MSEEVVVLKTFNNEIEAEMAQQMLQEAGVTAFVFKDDAGGMEPQLQRSNGVRLVVNRAEAQHAHKMLKTRSQTQPSASFFSQTSFLAV